MARWANYLIVGAVISMIVPFILDYLELLNNRVFWPALSIVLVSVGFVLHVLHGVLKQRLNIQTLLVLASILIIVLGFSLVQLDVKNTEYVLLLGMILVLVWLFIPNKRL